MRAILIALVVCAVAGSAAAQPPHRHYRSDWYKHDWPRYERPNPLGAFLGGIIGGFLAGKLRQEDERYEEDDSDEHR